MAFAWHSLSRPLSLSLSISLALSPLPLPSLPLSLFRGHLPPAYAIRSLISIPSCAIKT